ncbi:MAG: ion transporter [Phycisphaerae bacterium]|nr:ion transporter [Phycisphaerae bacterium]
MPAEDQQIVYQRAPWRRRLHEIIFEADTPAGKAFDILLLVAILLSVLVVLLDSVEGIRRVYHTPLVVAEWVFTILFTIEYILRLVCVRRPVGYAVSFFGIVDLLAIIPTYLTLLPFASGTQSLMVIRAIRLLRLFRIFKLARYLSEATALRRALWISRAKIAVFLATILIAVVIMGAAMYLVEGTQENSAYTSIPTSMYWAIVTMATVGYGDITPVTALGKMLTAVLILIGYSLIIIPTGIISAELAQAGRMVTTEACPECMHEGHDPDATHCKMCGARL